MKKLSLQEVLEGSEDTQRERSVWYPLHEVLFIMLTAVICGATSYVRIEMFGKKQEKVAKKVSGTGEWDTGCLYISECNKSDRPPATARGICGVDDNCGGALYRGNWGLDMQFREDENRARADNSAENLNVPVDLA